MPISRVLIVMLLMRDWVIFFTQLLGHHSGMRKSLEAEGSCLLRRVDTTHPSGSISAISSALQTSLLLLKVAVPFASSDRLEGSLFRRAGNGEPRSFRGGGLPAAVLYTLVQKCPCLSVFSCDSTSRRCFRNLIRRHDTFCRQYAIVA